MFFFGGGGGKSKFTIYSLLVLGPVAHSHSVFLSSVPSKVEEKLPLINLGTFTEHVDGNCAPLRNTQKETVGFAKEID